MRNQPPKFEHFSHCPVCSSTKIRLFRERTFDIETFCAEQIKITDSEYGKTWDLNLCTNCSHVFANPAPSQDFLQSLYPRIEDPLYDEEERGRGKNFKRILRRLGQIHPEKGILFDVGAATGILLNCARQQGWETSGIEPSLWAVRVAKEKYNLDLHPGSFQSVRLPKNHFTVATLIDFIEHISHPFEAVTKAHDILAPGGILCLVTPDVQSHAAKISGRNWWHYRPGHLGYFTRKSLQHLLNRAGFSITKVKRYSWTFSAHYILSRKRGLHFLIKNSRTASFWKKIPLKLALRDSLEVYAKKEQ
ncbi:MAG: class I SAM-dependent methyltransferase [Candidatus Aminicenantes bacterium]|nr:class I SAM-dependent methyltransferase [Candidatus Aminicenantes bacterium]